MGELQKKTANSLLIISFVLLVMGMALVLFSNNFIEFFYEFLSQKIFHRDFELAKWLPTMQSFFLMPILLVMMFNFLIFSKYNDKQKNILLIGCSLAALFAIIYCTAVTTNAHVNSDLASELLRAKECINQKTLLPVRWYYSTELCIMDTQLISTPLFFFTNNWLVVKTLTTFFCCVLLWLCSWYFLSKIEVKSTWIKILCSTFLVLPASGSTWYVIAWGNYYVSYIIFGFLYVAFYFALLKENKKRYLIFFYLLAFLTGLSTIRYIINYQFPLLLSIVIIEATSKNRKYNIYEIKQFWIKDKKVFHSWGGLIVGGVGYVINSLVLQRIFHFGNWNTITFNTLGDVKFLDVFRAIMGILGFTENVAVFTPSGIINILVYVGIVASIIFTVKALKVEMPYLHKATLIFTITTLAFNTFVYLHTELIYRYYCTIMCFLAPSLGVILSNKGLSDGKKYLLVAIWGTILFFASFYIIQTQFFKDDNVNKNDVINFLESNDYSFGYASFWNSNVLTYLTNGDIEVGTLESEDNVISKKYQHGKRLTPYRYYGDYKNNEHIFLLLSTDQYLTSKDDSSVKNGNMVYQDEYYVVFDYPSHEAFKESFDK